MDLSDYDCFYQWSFFISISLLLRADKGIFSIASFISFCSYVCIQCWHISVHQALAFLLQFTSLLWVCYYNCICWHSQELQIPSSSHQIMSCLWKTLLNKRDSNFSYFFFTSELFLATHVLVKLPPGFASCLMIFFPNSSGILCC